MCTSKITTSSSHQRSKIFFPLLFLPTLFSVQELGAGLPFLLPKVFVLLQFLPGSRLSSLWETSHRGATVRGDGGIHWVLRRHKLTRKTPSREEDMTKDVSLVGLVGFVLCFILKQKYNYLLCYQDDSFQLSLIFFICSHCCCCALQEYLTNTATIGGKNSPVIW